MQENTFKRPNYLIVFIVLAVFTLIETLVSYLQVPSIKYTILITVSIIKASLVLLYFMHLRFDSRIYTYLFIGGCLLSIPLILVMAIVMPYLALR